jgi:predicted house-cleaning noncanonical NTP pyrophosphatase (MazG superfamily)
VKLIRDRLAYRMLSKDRAKPEQFGFVASKDAFMSMLRKKLNEELAELDAALTIDSVERNLGSLEGVADEVVDLVEVAISIGNLVGLPRETILANLEEKRLENGSFLAGITWEAPKEAKKP